MWTVFSIWNSQTFPNFSPNTDKLVKPGQIGGTLLLLNLHFFTKKSFASALTMEVEGLRIVQKASSPHSNDWCNYLTLSVVSRPNNFSFSAQIYSSCCLIPCLCSLGLLSRLFLSALWIVNSLGRKCLPCSISIKHLTKRDPYFWLGFLGTTNTIYNDIKHDESSKCAVRHVLNYLQGLAPVLKSQ